MKMLFGIVVLALALAGCGGGGGDDPAPVTPPAPYAGPPLGAYAIRYSSNGASVAAPSALELTDSEWVLTMDNHNNTSKTSRGSGVYRIPNKDGRWNNIVPMPMARGVTTGAFTVTVPLSGVGSITCGSDAGWGGVLTIRPLTGSG